MVSRSLSGSCCNQLSARLKRLVDRFGNREVWLHRRFDRRCKYPVSAVFRSPLLASGRTCVEAMGAERNSPPTPTRRKPGSISTVCVHFMDGYWAAPWFDDASYMKAGSTNLAEKLHSGSSPIPLHHLITVLVVRLEYYGPMPVAQWMRGLRT